MARTALRMHGGARRAFRRAPLVPLRYVLFGGYVVHVVDPSERRVNDEAAAKPPMREERPRNNSTSLRRAMDILFAISDNDSSVHPHGMSLAELSAAAGINKSSALRLLMALRDYGMVTQRPPAGRWFLGAATATLGHQYLAGIELRSAASDLLSALALAVSETSHLTILDSTDIVYIDKAEAPAAVRMFSRIGMRVPAHCTASGKAILAYSDASVVDQVLSAGMRKFTERTVCEPAAFQRELDATRKRGFGIDDLEHQDDVRCVAAPVFDVTEAVTAAVSISGPAHRIAPSALEHLGEAAAATAKDISARLGSARR